MDHLAWCFVFLAYVHASAQLPANCGPPQSYPYTKLDERRINYNNPAKVYYKCDEDYVSSDGSRFIECVHGTWTKLALKCKKKSCGPPPHLLNGRFVYQGSLVGDQAQPVCNDGYKLKGFNENIICKSSGWSGNQPTCEEGGAALVPSVMTTCQKPSIDEGVVTGGSVSVYSIGESVTFTCNPGFSMSGSRQISCGLEGKWLPQLPTCLRSKASCKPHHNQKINNNTVVVGQKTEYKAGDSLSFSCTHFFTLIGSPTVTCASNGTWTSPRPKCKRLQCRELNITQGKLSSKHKRAGEEITITCDEGYQLRGAAKVVCLKEGKWSEVPTCESENQPQLGCKQPAYISSATVSVHYREQSFFPEGAKVRYMCHVGYEWKDGHPYRTCKGGTWTALQMICEPKSCGNAGEILYGSYEYAGTQFGDTIKAVCDHGYQLVGRATRRCMAGFWDGHPPVCEAVQCEDLREDPNMAITDSLGPPYVYPTMIGFRCRRGTLVGPERIYCTEDGTWSQQPPKCK
ncbi:sushi, von Willebrand factor type A, EGF and pentraxin domain-containing protein 1-like [Osmerus eperlanus]|uniref:sushi, von Willebrand factor type A, EGF and pentraxin domain-containing protein 1-like n=1 Tax=Osmerus eperlanus TaxID=29151 RepID=UPI002E0D96DB